MDLDQDNPSKPRLQWIIMPKQISNLILLTTLSKYGKRKMKENSKSSRTGQEGEKKLGEDPFPAARGETGE